MRVIYIDFEATQFSFDIISIGAVKDNGSTFYTLVKPPRVDRVTPLITKITGLTRDMFTDDLKPIEVVFPEFVKWCRSDCQNDEIVFATYGGFDRTLLKHGVKRFPNIPEFAYVLERWYDIERLLNKLAGFPPYRMASLSALYSLCCGAVPEDLHNPLCDSQMLREIHIKAQATSEEAIKVISENEIVDKYVGRYKRGRKHFKRELREYFDTLTEAELDTVTIEDLFRVCPAIYDEVENVLKNYYFLLKGKKLKGRVYVR